MKIALFNPSYGDNFVRVARWAAKSRGRVQRHPEYLLISAQILINNGHEVIFVEAAARNLTEEESYKIITNFKPDLLVVHVTTPSIYNDIKQVHKIKDKTNCKIVFVGQHVTAEIDNTFNISNGILNYIIRSEYDFTLRDLANGMNLNDIPGLSWIDESFKIHHNQNREPLDVKELPFPAWQLIKPGWYPDAGKKYPFLTLMTGRGCNNACSFCRDPQLMYGYKLRLRDAKQVVDEMEFDLKIHPEIREIMFETDTFTANKEHVTDICNEIIKRKLNKKISWSCNARVDIDLTLLPLMKKSGCRMLMVGFEFGHNEGLKAIHKGGVDIEMSRRFALEAHKHGFIIHGCFMFGAPGETKDLCEKTIQFVKSIPMDTVQFTGIAVYPGTKLYNWAKENNYLITKDWQDWLTKGREQKTLLSYPQLSNEEIDKFIDKGLKEFYLRPKQIWNMLISIRSTGDLLRKIYGLKAFIKYFFVKKPPSLLKNHH